MIIFDLDGTLADCEHRRHFVDPSKSDAYTYTCYNPLEGDNLLHNWGWWSKDGKKFKPNWPAFYEACDKDKPIEQVIYTLKMVRQNQEVQIWSGRCESTREKTLRWLNDSCGFGWVDKLLTKMRPIGDSTPDDQLKERWLDEAIAGGKKIEMIFDDRPKVVRMWRRRGIFVFNCCQHDEEF